MGALSVWHWLIFLVIALLFFGGSGKISSVMGDFAKGIKSFKKGLQDDAEEAKKEEAAPKSIEAQSSQGVQSTSSSSKVG